MPAAGTCTIQRQVRRERPHHPFGGGRSADIAKANENNPHQRSTPRFVIARA